MNETAEEPEPNQNILSLRIKTMDSSEVKLQVKSDGMVNDLKDCIQNVLFFSFHKFVENEYSH